MFEGPEVTGRRDRRAAVVTGLPVGTPVVAGGGDNACAAIGTGLIDEGHGVCSIGTSGTLFVHSVAPRIDPEGALNAFCDAVPGGYHLMGVILSAGGALGWLPRQDRRRCEADARRRPDPFAVLVERGRGRARRRRTGCLFLPYLAGERSPHMDPHARGAWIGLSLAHDRRHMVRALIEGVGLRLCRLPRPDAGARIEPQGVALTGGGARSAALAASPGRPAAGAASTSVSAGEGPALGAAILAQVGAGLHPTSPMPSGRLSRQPRRRCQATPTWSSAIARNTGATSPFTRRSRPPARLPASPEPGG